VQKSSSSQDEKHLAEIIRLIGEVENVKQIHLSEAERIALAAELFKLSEPLAKLKRRGEFVKRNKDYGRISFDVWVNAEPLYTHQEAWAMVLEGIEKRKRELRGTGTDVAKREGAGLVELEGAGARRLEQLREEIAARLKARAKRARGFLLSTDESIKQEIKALAERRGLMKDDPFWRETLPFMIPKLLEDVEKIMRRSQNSQGG